jgi:hypothetical protein
MVLLKRDRGIDKTYYDKQRDSLIQVVKYREKQIDSLKTVLVRHDDTIFVIERQKPIITNKYYYDEKVYLTSSDSVQRELRIRNQQQFEREYFEGRYNPSN